MQLLKLTSLLLAALLNCATILAQGNDRVFLSPGTYPEYDCASKEKVRDSQLPGGALFRILNESDSLLRIEELRMAVVLCIKARKRDLIQIPDLTSRDGTTPLFVGKAFGVEPPRQKGHRTALWASALTELDSLPHNLTVWVVQVVEKDGSGSVCQLLFSSGWKEFDDYALRRTCHGSFVPAMKDGQPVPVILIERVRR